MKEPIGAGPFLDLLYGPRKGYATVLFRRLTGGPWQECFAWPEERAALLGSVASRPHAEAFMSVLLRDAPNRRVEDSNPLPGRFVWLDVDQEDEALEPALLEIGLTVHEVRSGGASHKRHLYLDLGEVVDGHEVADLAQRASLILGTDGYGGNNKLLRLPGTPNLKPARKGGSPGWVTYTGLFLPGSRSGVQPLEMYLNRHGASALQMSRPPARGANVQRGLLKVFPEPNAEDPCLAALHAADAVRKGFSNGPRHEALLAPLTRLLRLQAHAHHGVPGLVDELRTEFVFAVSDARGGDQVAQDEFDRALAQCPVQLAKRAKDGSLCECDLGLLRQAAQDPHLLQGRNKRLDQDVLKSLVREAIRRRSAHITKAQRQIAEDAMTRQPTVSKALRRLQDAGVLQVLSHGREQTLVVLHLTDLRTRLQDSTEVPAPAGTSVDAPSRVAPTHPIFGGRRGLSGGQRLTLELLPLHGRRLGHSWLVPVGPAWRTGGSLRGRGWRRVTVASWARGLTPRQIAQRTNQPVDTVRRQLRRMRELRLVIRLDGLWYRTLWDPDMLAEQWGLADAPEKRRSQHRLEQSNFLKWKLEKRSRLPEGHPSRVLKEIHEGVVQYVDPGTGVVLGPERKAPGQ